MEGKLDDDNVDLGPWQKTYNKQRRALIKRGKGVEQDPVFSTDDTLADTIKASGVPATVEVSALPPRPASPHVATLFSAQTTPIPPAPVQATNKDSKPYKFFSASSPPDGQVTPAAESSKRVTSEGDDEQELICRAMTSLSVSSPNNASFHPQESQPPPEYTVPFRSSRARVRRPKYYVVSVGRCMGVFDNWPYVQSLTSGIRGNCQVSYASREEAEECYAELKQKRLLKVVRKSGDERLFGPVSRAVQ